MNETNLSYYCRIGLLILLPAFSFSSVCFSQKNTDSSRILLASLSKNEMPAYIVREANVVFPDILKGNELEALSYIEKMSSTRKDYLVRMYTKGKKLLPKAAAILKKHQLPEEFKVLLALESAYNPKAVSKAGAVGYWQFMDVAAKEYGLRYVTHITPTEKAKMIKQNRKKADSLFKALARQKDDRTNFAAASNAAARYLKDRRKNLNDNWLLVVASYNCGIGNVWNAMQKSGKTNPTFWDVKQYLPEETQNYVMNFIALNVIFNNYEKFVKNELIFSSEKIFFKQYEQPANDYQEDAATTGL